MIFSHAADLFQGNVDFGRTVAVEWPLYFDQIGLYEFFDRFDHLVLQFWRTLCDPNREVVEFLIVHFDPLFI